MKAIILAAGEGSRMRPLTYTRPKVMLPIANKPMLEHLLIEVSRAGIKEFIFIVGYHDEQARDYFGSGDKWGVNIDYSTQRQQLGTADALKMVEGLVDRNFLVLNGDIIVSQKDIKELLNKRSNTLCVVELEDIRGLGIVEISGDKVVHIYEKVGTPPSHMANAGLYLLTPDIFHAISQTPKSLRGEYEMTDSLQLMIDGGHHISYQEISHWLATLEVRETNGILTVHIVQLEIWSDVPNFRRKSIEPLLPGTIFSPVLSTVSARHHFFSDIEH